MNNHGDNDTMKIIGVACPISFKGQHAFNLQGFPSHYNRIDKYDDIPEFYGASIYLGMKKHVDNGPNPFLYPNPLGKKLDILG